MSRPFSSRTEKLLGLALQTFIYLISPLPRLSYQLGEQERFNYKFGKKDTTYTYLVPTNQAWEELRGKYATAYKVTCLYF